MVPIPSIPKFDPHTWDWKAYVVLTGMGSFWMPS